MQIGPGECHNVYRIEMFYTGISDATWRIETKNITAFSYVAR